MRGRHNINYSMKRIVLIAVLAVGLVSSGAWVSSAVASGQPACCTDDSPCAQGLQRESCCKAPNTGTAPGTVNQLSKTAPQAASYQAGYSITLELACHHHSADDEADDPAEKSELYLLNASFLI